MSHTLVDEYEIVGKHIVFKQIVHDDCPGNPLEESDAMGSIFSFSTRHNNYADRDKREELYEEYDKDIVFLSYFEHGNCKWGVKGSMSNMPDFRWDGVSAAGMWVPDKYLRIEAKNMQGEERRKKMEEWAGQACEVYTQWCNGEVYGVIVKAYKTKRHESGEVYDDLHDYRYDEPVFDESVFGLYGYAYAKETLNDEFMNWVKNRLEKPEEVVT